MCPRSNMTVVLIGRGEEKRRETHGEDYDSRGRVWSDTSRPAGNHQKLGRGREGFFLRNFRGSMVPGRLDFRLLASRAVRENVSAV